MGVNIKILKEKVKRSGRDVSTVLLLRVFLSQRFPFILFTSTSTISRTI